MAGTNTPMPTDSPAALPLTQLCSSAGCAAKLGQLALAELLRHSQGRRKLQAKRDPRVLVGNDTFDDAGVFQLRPDLALVQTVDFFPPIVDDPLAFGRIAATNALSDVYAMGGRPITALNLLGIPTDKLAASVVARITRGGAEKVAQAGAVLIGGHTIRAPEPIYGLSVTGVVHPRRILTNATARAGDLLILTKPIGTGIVTTAIKRGLAPAQLVRKAISSMTHLNAVGADLAEAKLITCATDITGFGLLGHLGNIVRASGVGAEVHASAVPLLSGRIVQLVQQDCIPGGTRNNRLAADKITQWTDTPEPIRMLLCDAQTSGGLLLCVPPRRLAVVQSMLKSRRSLAAAIIGQIVAARSPGILVRP
jgi:selenide,water dikinase